MPELRKVQQAPTTATNWQEAANRVLVGSARAASVTEDGVTLYEQAGPPVLPPPTGAPTETGIVQWAVQTTDTDISFEVAPTTVAVGSVFLIDNEYMTVNNISNADNIGVIRATHGSVLAAHAAGAQVSIWGNSSTKKAKPRSSH